MTTISGWACDSSQPNYQGWIHVWRDDSQFLGAVPAANYREQAVGNLCGGNSEHGFNGNLDYPASLIDGKKHAVHLYFIRSDGSNFELPNSPQYVQFGNPPPPPPTPLIQSGCNLTNPGPDWVATSWRTDYSCSPPSAPLSGTRMTYQYLGTQSPYIYKSGSQVVTCSSNVPAGWYSVEVTDSSRCPSNFYGYTKNSYLLRKY